ncbi:MAG: flagellar protein FlgN [Deltaproteobacteria bacterium]|nr:MAG: flagellar protein FlgN [Deltaproteobacteria bacterium]
MAPKSDDRKLLLPIGIFELLEKEVGFYQELLRLLDKERECLHSLSIEDLCAISKAKETEILKIKVVEENLKDITAGLFKNHGYVSEDTTITALMEVADKKQAGILKNYLAILTALKEDIRERNGNNKRFIEETLEVIEDSLSILMPPRNAPFYTSQGKNARCSCNANVLSREV